MRELIESGGGVLIDYIAIANADTLEELKQLNGPTVALVAGRVGTTRLIDNAVLPVA
jgi:pantoate--beta-alanine ligase